MKIKYLLLFLSLIVINSNCISQERITKEEAIKRAEDFVIEHGYAQKKLDIDSTKTYYDINEFYLSTEQIVELRHNSLIPEAIYAKKYGLNNWLVGFEFKNWPDSYLSLDTTRKEICAVIISGNGKKIEKAHQNYSVKKSELIKREKNHSADEK